MGPCCRHRATRACERFCLAAGQGRAQGAPDRSSWMASCEQTNLEHGFARRARRAKHPGESNVTPWNVKRYDECNTSVPVVDEYVAATEAEEVSQKLSKFFNGHPSSRTMPPIVIALIGLWRGTVMNRSPDRSTMCFP